MPKATYPKQQPATSTRRLPLARRDTLLPISGPPLWVAEFADGSLTVAGRPVQRVGLDDDPAFRRVEVAGDTFRFPLGEWERLLSQPLAPAATRDTHLTPFALYHVVYRLCWYTGGRVWVEPLRGQHPPYRASSEAEARHVVTLLEACAPARRCAGGEPRDVEGHGYSPCEGWERVSQPGRWRRGAGGLFIGALWGANLHGFYRDGYCVPCAMRRRLWPYDTD